MIRVPGPTNVELKKQPARISFTADRFTITSSIFETHILNTKITALMVNKPSPSGKLLLKITAEGIPYAFSFASISERDVCKEWFANVIAINTQSANRTKCAVLTADPHLKLVHKKTVIEGILNEDDFWNPDSRRRLVSVEEWKERQKVGQTAVFDAGNIAPSNAGSDGLDVRYTLTPQIIKGIFQEHPQVKKVSNY